LALTDDDWSPREHREHAPRHDRGVVLFPDIRQDDGELVAAEARDRVALACARLEPARYLAQQQVARVVPARVVDLFEAVQVNEQQGQRQVVPARVRECLPQAVVEQRAVRQVRQGVVVGQVAEAVVDALPLDGIAQGAHEPLAVDLPLDQVVLRPLAHARDGERRVVEPAHHDDGHVRCGGVEAHDRLEPVGVRQRQVEQDRLDIGPAVGAPTCEEAHRVGEPPCVRHREGGAGHLGQHLPHDAGIGGVVLDD